MHPPMPRAMGSEAAARMTTFAMALADTKFLFTTAVKMMNTAISM